MIKKYLIKVCVVFQCIIGSTELICSPLGQKENNRLKRAYIAQRRSISTCIFVVKDEQDFREPKIELPKKLVKSAGNMVEFADPNDNKDIYIYFKSGCNESCCDYKLEYPVKLLLDTGDEDNIEIEFSKSSGSYLIPNEYYWLIDKLRNTYCVDLKKYRKEKGLPKHTDQEVQTVAAKEEGTESLQSSKFCQKVGTNALVDSFTQTS